MGGIGLSSTNLNRIPHAHTYAHTYAHRYTHNQSYTCKHMHMHKNKKYTISGYYAHNMHTICTHTNKTICSTQKKKENSTENNTNIPHTSTHTQPQHRYSTYDYRTYSLDYYHEFAYIKNSNTIELYTILNE